MSDPMSECATTAGRSKVERVEQPEEPRRERVEVEAIGRSGLTEAGHIGGDHEVFGRERGDDRCPHGAAALDAAVEQEERATRAAGDDAGSDSVDLDDAPADGEVGEHVVVGCAHGRTSVVSAARGGGIPTCAICGIAAG